jgi:ABC-2 type transport system ATP-binding protein
MSTPILLARDIEKTVRNEDIFSKRYSRLLWRIPELRVENPGLYVIAGRNGAGKSTLIRCLLGLLKPDKGSISWYGNQCLDASLAGYLPEFPVIPPSAVVRNWLQWLLDAPVSQYLNASHALSNHPSLNITSLLEVPANRLSKGQQQRVQLWAAIVRDPKLVFLDEPFSGLDPWARVELAGVIKSITDSGRSVFMSTHELPQDLRALTSETWLIEDSQLRREIGCILPA